MNLLTSSQSHSLLKVYLELDAESAVAYYDGFEI